MRYSLGKVNGCYKCIGLENILEICIKLRIIYVLRYLGNSIADFLKSYLFIFKGVGYTLQRIKVL